MRRLVSSRFNRLINLPVLLEPLKIAAPGMRFDLPQQFNNVRLKTRLTRIIVRNDCLDFNCDDESIGSHQSRSRNSLA
jgi:hypothetical protein